MNQIGPATAAWSVGWLSNSLGSFFFLQLSGGNVNDFLPGSAVLTNLQARVLMVVLDWPIRGKKNERTKQLQRTATATTQGMLLGLALCV